MDKIKILVVDDESRMRKLVKDFLSKSGYEVLEAGDGEEAVDRGLIDEIGGLREAIAWLKATVKKEKGDSRDDKDAVQSESAQTAGKADRS